MNHHTPMNYVRLCRNFSDSWITFHLAQPMLWKDQETYDKLTAHLAFVMPGWELMTACPLNPDPEEDQANEAWPTPQNHDDTN